MKVNTSGYHPQTNGSVERMHAMMEDMLAAYARDDQANWDLWIPYVQFAMNTSNHATTHHTPFYLLYGHEARLPSELRELYPHDGLTSTLVVELVQRLQEAYEIVRFHRQQSGEQSAQRYNTGRRVVSYEPHTMVWLFVPSVRRGQSPKLAAFWQGPYEVLEKSNDGLNYKLLDRTAAAGFRGRKLEQTVHVNRLKPFITRATKPTEVPAISANDAFDDSRDIPAYIAQQIERLQLDADRAAEAVRLEQEPAEPVYIPQRKILLRNN